MEAWPDQFDDTHTLETIPEIGRNLMAIDQWISVGGVALAGFILITWLRRGRGDPLRDAPARTNSLDEVSLAIPTLAYLAGFAVLAAILGESGNLPAGGWGRVAVVSGSHVIGAVACLWMGARAFGGWRRLVFGAPDIARRGAGTEAVAACVLALGVCPLVLWLTVAVVRLLAPEQELAPHPTIESLRTGQAAAVYLALWVGAAVIAPVAEELFFRGLVQTYLVNAWGRRWRAVIVSSGLFALVHTGQPYAMPALFALSLLLGFLYERRGALVWPIALHAVFNLKTLVWEALGGAAS